MHAILHYLFNLHFDSIELFLMKAYLLKLLLKHLFGNPDKSDRYR